MNYRTKIIANTIKEVVDNSIGKFSTIEIAKKTGCSEAYIFKLFKTKKNLLLESYLYIDMQLEKKITRKAPESIDSYEDYLKFFKCLVIKIVDFLSERREYALYYSNFRMSNLYNDAIYSYETHIRTDLVEYFDKASDKYDIYCGIKKELYWMVIMDVILSLSKREAEINMKQTIGNSKKGVRLIIDRHFEQLKQNNK